MCYTVAELLRVLSYNARHEESFACWTFGRIADARLDLEIICGSRISHFQFTSAVWYDASARSEACE